MKTLPNADLISQMSPKRKALLAKIEISKRRALSDLYYFDREVLGYNLMVPHVHKKLCLFTQKPMARGENEQSTKLILEPRNTFKSRCVTIGYTLWRLARDPNLTVLITNGKLEKSKEFLAEIKGHITSNERFKLLFGEWSCENKPGKRWSADRIDIAVRSTWGSTPSVQASSAESAEAGGHFDLIIADDLHNEENTTTKERIDGVIEYYQHLGPVLKPGAEEIVIGTRWDYKDVYSYILQLKEELGELSNIEILIEQAVREDGSLLFPEFLSKEFLARQRAKLGAYMFNCQYINDPVQKENSLVKRVDKYGEKVGNKSILEFFKGCNHFVTVDLAYTEDKRSDSTAIVCNAVNPSDGKWYIRRYDVLKTGDPDRVIDLLFEYNKTFAPVRFGIEKNNYTSWLKKPLEDRMRKSGVWLPIDPPDGVPHYGPGKNKALRLRSLAPRFNYGETKIAHDMTALEDELLKLTYDGARGKDDLLDALAMQEEIVVWGSQRVANTGDNAAMEARKAQVNEEYAGIYEDANDNAWVAA